MGPSFALCRELCHASIRVLAGWRAALRDDAGGGLAQRVRRTYSGGGPSTGEVAASQGRGCQQNRKNNCNGPEWADIVFQDERYIWGWGDGYARLTSSQGICRHDVSKRPGRLDLTDTTGQLAGVTRRCIYLIDGETLEIASTTDQPANRPESFEGHVMIYTLKRAKK